MEIKINIAKRHLYIFSAIVGVLIGILTVNAFDSGGPASNFGHSVDEVDWSKPIQGGLLVNGPISVRGQSALDSDVGSGYVKVGDLASGGDLLGFKAYSNGVAVIVAETNGNVGIGTTPGGYKLDVQGDQRISGELKIGSSPSILYVAGGGACPAGSVPLLRNYVSQTCNSVCGGCSTAGGWLDSEVPKCPYFVTSIGGGCVVPLTCTSTVWTGTFCVR